MTRVDEEDRTEAAEHRKLGRGLVIAIHAANRAMKLYPPEHASVNKALEELVSAADRVVESSGELDVRTQAEFIFVNGTRLRLDLSNYASFGRVLELLRGAGVGSLHMMRRATARDWYGLLALFAAAAGRPQPDCAQISAKLAQAGINSFELAEPSDAESDDDEREVTRAAARRTYAQSVSLTKDVINSVRMGRAPSSRKIKRAVQSIVDEVLNEETSLMALTTLREYDEYTYTHSVNVCIFAVALGKRLGLTKLQLYELGLAALMHDIGKSRIPGDVIRKSGTLDEDDWRRITAHPWLGVLTLFQMRGQTELPYRAMLVAYEHHMKGDSLGYPTRLRKRTLAMSSRIVAVADGYDAATSRRTYQTNPMPPSAVLQEMRDNPLRGMDPVVVKAFINLLGIYPPGTLVVLDTLELAVVRAGSTDPEMLSRPTVVLISDNLGNFLAPPVQVELSARGADGNYLRTIIKTADPDRYGVRVSDYIV